MATEYGIRDYRGNDTWGYATAEKAIDNGAKYLGFTLIAREVSEPRIVSIRA